MSYKLFEYNYTPLLDLFESDFIDLNNSHDYIPFGEDNLLPQQIIQLSRSVAVHRAILNSKTFFIAGNGFVSENADVSVFITSVNNFKESLRDVFFKVLFDELNIGNGYLEIITDKNKSFLSLFHIDGSKCRLSANADTIIIHPDWAAYKSRKDELRQEIPLYPIYKKDDNGLYRSVLHIKQYEPEFYHYGLPTWYAGLNSVIIAGLTDVWNQSRLERQFNASGLLVIPGVNDDKDAEVLDAEFDKFKGAANEKSHDLIVQYLKDLGPGQQRDLAQYIEFKKNEEGNWIELHKQAHTNLLSIHNWFKSLASFFGEKTGFDTKRILNEYEIALNTSIRVYQSRYLEIFSRLLSDFGFNITDLDISNESPVYRISPVKYVWEVRRDMGLEYDPEDPKQKLFYSELKNKFTTDSDKEEPNDKEY
ncbi:MAG: hypothetical protein KQI35_01160 [Bacteroidetes bacterium]|nr:hypothetical protein [Bacteroidota bacterium]